MNSLPKLTTDEKKRMRNIRRATGCGGPKSKACHKTAAGSGLCFCLFVSKDEDAYWDRTNEELKAEFVRELLEA